MTCTGVKELKGCKWDIWILKERDGSQECVQGNGAMCHFVSFQEHCRAENNGRLVAGQKVSFNTVI